MTMKRISLAALVTVAMLWLAGSSRAVTINLTAAYLYGDNSTSVKLTLNSTVVLLASTTDTTFDLAALANSTGWDHGDDLVLFRGAVNDDDGAVAQVAVNARPFSSVSNWGADDPLLLVWYNTTYSAGA